MIIPRPYQADAANIAKVFFHGPARNPVFIVMPTGCHNAGTGILMFDGSIKPVEEIIVGDKIMGPDSNPREVLNLCGGKEEMYEVTPLRGGKPFIVNKGHILHLECSSESKSKKFDCIKMGGEIDNISVEEYLSKSKNWKTLRKLKKAPTIEFPCNSTKIHLPPYILGVILGDGCVMNGIVSVTSADHEIVKEVCDYVEYIGMSVRIETKKGNAASSYLLTKKTQKHNRMYENPIMSMIRALKLDGKDSSTKFIPIKYKTGSIDCRREILAGLLDTDGYLHHNGYDYVSKSEQLASDVTFIARSLGLIVSQNKCTKSCQTGASGNYYRVSISGHTNIIPCRIERKKAIERKQTKNPSRSGFSIKPVGVDANIAKVFFHGPARNPVFIVIPSGAGKSVIIAETVRDLDGMTLVLQPSKEILEQNYEKYTSMGFRAGIYSDSVGHRYIDRVTFATIGSIVNKPHLFRGLKNIITDECHWVKYGGQYTKFFSMFPMAKNLGLTASPYRMEPNREGAILEFLNRPRYKTFHSLVYYVQNETLFDQGFLAEIDYNDINVIDRSKLVMNDSGTDFTDGSIRAMARTLDLPRIAGQKANELLEERKNLLAFCTLVSEAEALSKKIPGSKVITGDTDKALRGKILRSFKEGDIKAIVNCQTLLTGYDYPELETVLDVSPTMSLGRFYQKVGRGCRIHANKKDCKYVDLVGNHQFFGDIESMKIRMDYQGNYDIWNGNRRLTGVNFKKF